MYECTAVGGGFTLWNGSAFHCTLSGNEIFIPHGNNFNHVTKTCNGGAIVGQSIRMKNNVYTSRLIVNTTSELNGTTVECSQDSRSSSVTLIGKSVIRMTTGKYIYL